MSAASSRHRASLWERLQPRSHRSSVPAQVEPDRGTDAPPALHSAIYTGWVRHRRRSPHPHAFRYRLFMAWLDLAELDRVFDGRWLWSVGRGNVAQFRRSDYLGDPSLPLDEAVRRRVEEVTGRRPTGPIRLLTHLRYFGWCFNPVSFYYCYADDGDTLDTIVAEITNTPWGERHSYVLPLAEAERCRQATALRGSAERGEGVARVVEFAFDKAFHVSPFLPLDRRYRWRFTPPAAELRVHMDVIAASGTEFDATLVLARKPITGRNLAATLLAHPWMTARVSLGIYWQAFLVWCKRNPVYDHPGAARPGAGDAGGEDRHE